MNPYSEYRAFLAVIDAGSFVAAAEQLALSKSGLSKLITDLEARLGLRLLHRTTRRLSLTSEGEVFVIRARELLAAWQDIEQDLWSRQQNATGRIRINAPVSYGIRVLAPLWAKFRQLNPQVELDLVLSDRISDLVEEGFDVAIRIHKMESSSLVSRRLAAVQLLACAAPNYLAKAGALQQPADLKQHQVIAYSYFSGGDHWQFQYAKAASKSAKKGAANTSHPMPLEPQSVRIKPWMHCNNGDTCMAVAIAGGGVILQPNFIVQQALQSGELVRILPDWQVAGAAVYAVYASRRHVPLKLRRLIDFLAEQLA